MQIPKISDKELTDFENSILPEGVDICNKFAVEQPEMFQHISNAIAAGIVCPCSIAGAAYCYYAIRAKVESDALEELFKFHAK